ncbi:MAG: hypothetical protein EOO50_17405, partial [Flavobacterium sp.]|uniref:hypothetical protein n=1 Tax=Flavobacterium sp. TaxID=239 RepID=UPI001229E3A3
MKKLLLTLSLLPVLSFSQIINFSDPNFKTMLLSASASNTIAENLQNANFKIDVNNDGEIQQSEALQVKRLKLIGGNIVSIPELIEFANLTELQVENNTILAFNLSDHPALQEIDWRNNQTTNFSVNNIQTLTRLGLTAHQLTAISVVGCPLVEYSVNSDGITSLDLAGLNSLSYFSYEGNSLGALYNIAGLPSLQYVSIYEEAPMVALDLSNTTSLTFLSVRSESLQSLNLSGCSSLSYIDMSSAVNVSNLNLTGCIALDDLYLSMNQGLEELELDGLLALNNLTITLSEITSLHISNCPLLESVDAILGNLSQYAIENCPSLTSLMFDGNHLSGSYSLSEFPLLNYYNVGGNQISAIDFSGCTELESIDVTGNQLTQLDVSDCHSLVNLFAEGNPLETILAKNGSVESYLGFSYYGGNNGEEILLKFICADEAQIESIQASINSSLPENDIVVSSYCSFTPGGNFNTITGIARVDADTNGCSASDVTVPNVKVKINDGTDQGYTFVETDGTYSFYTATGNFAISAEYENPTYFVASAPITVNFPAENGSIFNQDICVVPNGVHPDLEIIIAPTNQAQPGFDATYEILYRNKGNQTLSGDFTLNFEDDVLDFLQASSAPISQTANSLAWNFSTLQPFASGSVWVNFNVNGPMETPPVNIDDVLDFTATINPI